MVQKEEMTPESLKAGTHQRRKEQFWLNACVFSALF